MNSGGAGLGHAPRPTSCPSRCLHPGRRLARWLRALRATFSLSFLLAIATVYFVQGFASFSELAVGYLLKDELKLQSGCFVTVQVFGIVRIHWLNLGFRYPAQVVAEIRIFLAPPRI